MTVLLGDRAGEPRAAHVAGQIEDDFVHCPIDDSLAARHRVLTGLPSIKDANLGTSTGDEAGSAGGLVSSKIKGKLTWLGQSMNVKFEGKGVIRFLDPNMHNGNMGNTPSMNAGSAGGGAARFEEPKCPVCNKPFNGHKDVIPPRSKDSDKAAAAVLAPSKPRAQWTPAHAAKNTGARQRRSCDPFWRGERV